MSNTPSLPSPLLTEDGAGATMGFFDHLDELRSRLVKVLIALLIALLGSAFFVRPLLEYLIVPCDCELVLLKPTDGIVMYFRVALMSAGIVIEPFITYQILMFI